VRKAILVAPSEVRAGDPSARRMALAWLRGRLARFGFEVAIVGGGRNLRGDLEKAFDAVSPGDSVLLHVSGRLEGRDALAAGDEPSQAVPLFFLFDGLAPREPSRVSLIAELTHDEDPDDPFAAAECLEAAVAALGARERGHLTLAALRPSSSPVERVAFTRLTFPPPTGGATALSEEALLAVMHERAVATTDSYAFAQSFIFAVPGAPATLPELPLDDSDSPVDDESSGPDLSEAPGEAAEVDQGWGSSSDVAGAAAAAMGRAAATPPVAPASAPRTDAPGAPGATADEPLDATLTRLIEEATQTKQWDLALELRRRRLDTTVGSRPKVRELVAIARILQAELHDPEGALQALEVARAIDRSRVSVLQALRRGYESMGRWESAAEVIGTMADVAGSSLERAALRHVQGRMLLDRLGDEDRALVAFMAALEEDPSHHEAQGALAKIRSARGELDAPAHEELAHRHFAEGNEDAGVAELEAAAMLEPMRTSVYAALFDAHRRAGRTDASLLAALSLEELGGAEVDQQMLVGQFRQVTPIRARTSFDEAAWLMLRAPGYDEVLASVFSAVERAAVETRVEELRRHKKLVKVDPANRLGENSTASVARSFQWAARVMTVNCPDLYVAQKIAGGIGALQAAAPSTALGPEVLSGPGAKDLAFLAARHLTYYRPEHHALIYYTTREELTNLLLAAVEIAMPTPESPSLGAPVRALHARMEKRISKEERDALGEAVAQLDARGGKATIGAFIRSVELTAARVGLVLSGDLASAGAIVRNETRSIGGVATEVKRGDLVAFNASSAHATLRARFATTAPESLRPVPTASGVHVVI
jgi:hypothetical protein